ncbi:hypothetical protein BGZ76_002395 [Entomortierella beljakovae]|nr:hypothetical protein BGZ76_002395 [Entomortierella beljakovae]
MRVAGSLAETAGALCGRILQTKLVTDRAKQTRSGDQCKSSAASKLVEDTAEDGTDKQNKKVILPPSPAQPDSEKPCMSLLIFKTASRDEFKQALDGKEVSDKIILPSIGQKPKDYGQGFLGDSFFITEQMMEMRGEFLAPIDSSNRNPNSVE